MDDDESWLDLPPLVRDRPCFDDWAEPDDQQRAVVMRRTTLDDGRVFEIGDRITPRNARRCRIPVKIEKAEQTGADRIR